jgi:hypothetical protein
MHEALGEAGRAVEELDLLLQTPIARGAGRAGARGIRVEQIGERGDLVGRRAVGEVVPRAAGARERRRGRQGVESPEQPPERREAAGVPDRLSPLGPRDAGDELRHEHRLPIEHGDGLGLRAALGGIVERGQRAQDLGVAAGPRDRPLGGKEPRDPAATVG